VYNSVSGFTASFTIFTNQTITLVDPIVALAILGGYILLLIIISSWKGEDSENATFFIGRKESPWYVVAFGMIGASLSGVTFLSVPGAVANDSFSYMQMVIGYLPGYMFIAFVLMPVYYRLNLTTIYGYLGERFGKASHKTGSAFFLLSRIVGASFRIYLVVIVLQIFICDDFGIPFWATVAFTIIIIWLYTFKSGIKSIVWTDSLQTLAMLTAVVITILMIGNKMDLDFSGIVHTVRESDMSQTFFFADGWQDGRNFWKKFLAGASIAIVMTGLDQDMMQKNLSCRNIGEAQKNMVSFSIVLLFANVLFLALGALLYIFATDAAIDLPAQADKVFPMIAKSHLGTIGGAIFFIGVIAAAFSSADSALTSLTTVVCVDFLGFERKEKDEESLKKTRIRVHILLSLLLFAVILLFRAINNDSVINDLFRYAGYTYGPLLGLFMLGLFTKARLKDPLVPVVCILAPFAAHGVKMLLDKYTAYNMGFEFLILNGLVTFTGLLLASRIGRHTHA
jgi:SSS family transporter